MIWEDIVAGVCWILFATCLLVMVGLGFAIIWTGGLLLVKWFFTFALVAFLCGVAGSIFS